MFADKLKVIAGIAIVAVISGCGFEPLYQSGGDALDGEVVSKLSDVKIEIIADREGQILRNHLLDKINYQGEPQQPKYFLDTKLKITKDPISYRKDGTVQRYNVQTHVDIKLFASKEKTNEKSNKKQVLYEDSVDRYSSYSVGEITSEFVYASTMSESEAKRRALLLVADEIHLLLATYFKKWRDQPQRDISKNADK